MKLIGYYVCQDGLVWTVTQTDNKFVNNLGSEVLIVKGDVYVGCRELDGGFMVDDEFALW